MTKIGVNPPKTPVTSGSQDRAQATMPNVCKMPGPPAPFIATPLQNLGRSEDRMDDATSTVKFEGNKVAICGTYYMSQPSADVASQGTGGGIASNCVQGKTKFVAPGSMDTKAEGKCIQVLGTAMSNNGSQNPNSGAGQNTQGSVTKTKLDCGEVGSYAKLKEKAAAPEYERDHIPSKAALIKAAHLQRPGMSTAQGDCVKTKLTEGGLTIATPKGAHRGFSRTCGGRNQPSQIEGDAQDLNQAKKKDIEDMVAAMSSAEFSYCAEAYNKAAEQIMKDDPNVRVKQAVDDCLKAFPK